MVDECKTERRGHGKSSESAQERQGNREEPVGGSREYFDLTIQELQSLGKWAASCAERALSVYEKIEAEDYRPREAINGIIEFSNGGKRTNKLRKLALDAYRASLEAKHEAASAAAKSASLAAASAYTHPFKDIRQAEHILGPAAYSALALELNGNGDQEIGKSEIRWAIENVNSETVKLLAKMPERNSGKRRIEKLLYDLDHGIREKNTS